MAVVVIPGDVAIQNYEAPFLGAAALAIRQPVVVPAADQLDALADLLNRAPPGALSRSGGDVPRSIAPCGRRRPKTTRNADSNP